MSRCWWTRSTEKMPLGYNIIDRCVKDLEITFHSLIKSWAQSQRGRHWLYNYVFLLSWLTSQSQGESDSANNEGTEKDQEPEVCLIKEALLMCNEEKEGMMICNKRRWVNTFAIPIFIFYKVVKKAINIGPRMVSFITNETIVFTEILLENYACC